MYIIMSIQKLDGDLPNAKLSQELEQLSNQYKGNENEIRKLVCWADVHMNLPVLER